MDSTDSTSEKLSDDLRAIYDAERALPAALDAAARLRVLAAVAQAVPAASAVFSLASVIAASLISAVVGAAIAVTVMSVRNGNDSVAPIAVVIDAAPSPELINDATPTVVVDDAPPLLVDAPLARQPHRAADAQPAESPLGTTMDERNLIDRARSALARGKPHDAMLALMEHERTYAAGTMLEDREYLIITALVAQDKRDLAAARAAVYRTNYPHGSYRDAIARVLGE